MIIVDTETGGLDHERDALLSVAAIHVESGAQFYHYVRPFPSFRCDPEAEKIHGLSREFLEVQGLEEADVMERFAAWLTSLAPQDWAGCNPAFDQRFLDAAFERSGLSHRMGRRPVCIQTVAYMADRLGAITLPTSNDGLKSRSLDSILSALGISRPSGRHDALEDCRCTMAALQHLLIRLRPDFLMKSQPICSRPKKPAGNGGDTTTPPPCPGTRQEAATVTSGADCEHIPDRGDLRVRFAKQDDVLTAGAGINENFAPILRMLSDSPAPALTFISLAGSRYEWDGFLMWRHGSIDKEPVSITLAEAWILVQQGDWKQTTAEVAA